MIDTFTTDDYLIHLERRNLSPATVRRYGNTLRSYQADVDPTEVSTADIEAWLDRHSPSPKSRHLSVAILAGFHRWMVNEGQRADDPMSVVVRPKMPRHLPRPIATEGLALAVEYADTRMRCWLSLAAYGGLRCIEIAGLRAEDVHVDRDPAVLHLTTTKGRKERVIPIGPAVVDPLMAFGIPDSGPIFGVRPDTVSRQVSAYLAELGVRATAHQLRHWFATEVHRSTNDLRLVQELLGHADISTTAVYVKLAPSGAAIDAVLALGGFQASTDAS